jgi:flavin reductase (DIM6/NTAB) family NADH-FMN oxidoreductase RutF
MELRDIPLHEFSPDIFQLFDDRWFLLTAGDFQEGSFNTMTVSWGSLGIMWNKPIAHVVVRPSRHTWRFIEQYESFTLCAFPDRYHDALSLLGTRSGRDGDKIAAAGLIPCPASRVLAPAFEEADLVIECRKIYWHDFDPARFLDPSIERNYPGSDYHRSYYGEILAIQQERTKG